MVHEASRITGGGQTRSSRRGGPDQDLLRIPGPKKRTGPLSIILAARSARLYGIDDADLTTRGRIVATAKQKPNGQQSLPLKPERTKKLDVSALENWLWEAACTIRGPLDAPKFKDYILPLIFLKRLSDVFDDEVAHLAHEFGDVKKAAKLVEQDHKLVRFYMPQEGPVVVHRREVNRPGRASDGCGAGDRQGEPTALGCDRLDRLQPHGGRSADGR